MMSSDGRRRFHFALAVLTLGVSAGFMQEAKSQGWLVLIKKPLPIRKPLKDFARDCISPFVFVASQRLPIEQEAELGTEEYLNWVLKPPGAQKGKEDQVNLSVSYYTGKQDQVPHVPEECFYVGAYSLVDDRTVNMEMAHLGQKIDVRCLTFCPPRKVGTKSYVYYIICVNGDFFSERNSARLRMAKHGDTHLFYSKVEVSFSGVSDEQLPQTDEYARELIDATITELVRSHWPLRGWEQGGPPADV
ncbi:MAG: exosortase-associated EpsI family protein [Phycisphaerae bacterium]|nr:exosortase-associated EpsI family protein [Phycisphaerae bacterium]